MTMVRSTDLVLFRYCIPLFLLFLLMSHLQFVPLKSVSGVLGFHDSKCLQEHHVNQVPAQGHSESLSTSSSWPWQHH